MTCAPLRRRSSFTLLASAAALIAVTGCAGAPEPADVTEAPIARGGDIQMNEHNDVSAPLTLLPPAPRSSVLVEHEVKRIPRHFNTAQATDPVVQATAPAPLAPATSLNFNGVGNGFSGPSGAFTVNSAPPDTNGDVGPNHYVQIVNSDFAIFNKAGTAVFGPVAINTLWSGFGGGCQTNNDGDPVVVYDPIANRWVISQFSVSGANGGTVPFLQCVAVSQTADPTGSYFRYSFPYTGFNDYPKMGVWPDAYYTTFNMFNAAGTAFQGAKVCAYDRAKMLAGQAATQVCFNTSTSFGGLLPADVDGARLPPAGSPAFMVALGATANTLAFWKFHVDFVTTANSTFTGPTTLATAAYSEACAGGTCIPQSGTTQQLDSLADRLMFRLAYRNFADGHEALVVNHSITAGSSTGVRWYELRPDVNRNLSIFQQGTYAPDANFRWMGSIATDQSGNMALGFSVSSSTLHPEIHYTGRLAGDAAGTMTQGEGTIINGAGSQTGQSLSRWGDYSNMTVDPSDDCTFWYTTEYIPANGAFNWSTRIGSFKFPGCGGVAAANDFSISASPTTVSVTTGGSGSTTISTALVSGTAETVSLSVSGVPAGATASFSPASVTAGGSSTLTLNSGTAAVGTYTLTVTGTAASATHSTTVTFTIRAVAANDFSISASPASVSVTQGGSASSTIATATTSGSAQTVSLSVSGAPAGVTATLSPTSVTSGGSSTLSISTTTTATTGTFTLTVTGTAASGSHSTTVTLTVNAASGCTSSTQILVNPGFESGSTGWTATAGVIDASTAGSAPHSGTVKAWLDGYGTTHTDTIFQTVTIPSTACSATVSFWLKITTSETTTTTAFDKLTVTVRNTSNTVLSTLATFSNLNKGTTYVQRSFDVTAFKGQTVRIHFSGTEDSSLQTSFFIDDTALTVVQ